MADLLMCRLVMRRLNKASCFSGALSKQETLAAKPSRNKKEEKKLLQLLVLLQLLKSTSLSVAPQDVWSFGVYREVWQLLQLLILLQLLASTSSSAAPQDVWSLRRYEIRFHQTAGCVVVTWEMKLPGLFELEQRLRSQGTLSITSTLTTNHY